MIETLLKKLPWAEGRQGTGYKKLKLFESKKLHCDVYLLYYPVGSSIPKHVDPVDSKEHYRVNVVLNNAKRGGALVIYQGNLMVKNQRFVYFRPDVAEHEVTMVLRGYRLILSIGWAKKFK